MKRGVILGIGLLGGALSVKPAEAVDARGRWLGTWQMSYTANFSSCPKVTPGETKMATLTVSVVDGELQVTEKAQGEVVTMIWQGDPSNMVLVGRQDRSSFVIELGTQWSGRRVVATNAEDATGAYACATIYDVKARRK